MFSNDLSEKITEQEQLTDDTTRTKIIDEPIDKQIITYEKIINV